MAGGYGMYGEGDYGGGHFGSDQTQIPLASTVDIRRVAYACIHSCGQPGMHAALILVASQGSTHLSG